MCECECASALRKAPAPTRRSPRWAGPGRAGRVLFPELRLPGRRDCVQKRAASGGASALWFTEGAGGGQGKAARHGASPWVGCPADQRGQALCLGSHSLLTPRPWPSPSLKGQRVRRVVGPAVVETVLIFGTKGLQDRPTLIPGFCFVFPGDGLENRPLNCRRVLVFGRLWSVVSAGRSGSLSSASPQQPTGDVSSGSALALLAGWGARGESQEEAIQGFCSQPGSPSRKGSGWHWEPGAGEGTFRPADGLSESGCAQGPKAAAAQQPWGLGLTHGDSCDPTTVCSRPLPLLTELVKGPGSHLHTREFFRSLCE